MNCKAPDQSKSKQYRKSTRQKLPNECRPTVSKFIEYILYRIEQVILPRTIVTQRTRAMNTTHRKKGYISRSTVTNKGKLKGCKCHDENMAWTRKGPSMVLRGQRENVCMQEEPVFPNIGVKTCTFRYKT